MLDIVHCGPVVYHSIRTAADPIPLMATNVKIKKTVKSASIMTINHMKTAEEPTPETSCSLLQNTKSANHLKTGAVPTPETSYRLIQIGLSIMATNHLKKGAEPTPETSCRLIKILSLSA